MVKWSGIPLFLPSFCHLCPPTVPVIPRSIPTFYTCSVINVVGADEAQIYLIHNQLPELRGKKSHHSHEDHSLYVQKEY